MLNRGDLIELDDGNKYFVADIFQDLGKIFLTLSNYDAAEKLKFAILNGENVIEIQNPKLIEYVAKKANENLHKKEVLDSII